jgi:hypothetical protein
MDGLIDWLIDLLNKKKEEIDLLTDLLIDLLNKKKEEIQNKT